MWPEARMIRSIWSASQSSLRSTPACKDPIQTVLLWASTAFSWVEHERPQVWGSRPAGLLLLRRKDLR